MVSQERIVEKVREIMNEAGENAVQPDSVFLSEDTLSLDKYIVSCIPDAVLMVITNSARCVNPKENSSVSVVQEAGENYGHIVCPDDFVTLVALKMKGWKRIVSKTYGTDSETYRAQCNEAASLVYSIFENPDTAKQMQVIAINLLSGNNDTAD